MAVQYVNNNARPELVLKVKAATKATVFATRFFAFLAKILLFAVAIKRDLCHLFSDERDLKKGYAEALRAEFAAIQIPENDFDPIQVLKKFQTRIETNKLSPNEIRKEIVELTKEPWYTSPLPVYGEARNLLQKFGVALESTTDLSSFKQYGRGKLEPYLPTWGEELSYSQFCAALEKAQADSSNNRDSRVQTAVWGAVNTSRLWHVGGACLDPLGYNGYENQAVFMGSDLTDGEHRIQHKYSPGLTGKQSIVQTVLIPNCASRQARWVHIDNQSVHKEDERMRLAQINQIEAPGTFYQAIISTDPTQAVTRQFEQDGDLDAYFQTLCGEGNKKIRNFAQTEGIYIPETLLNDNQLNAALTVVRDIITALPLDGLERKEIFDVVQRTMNSVLSWAIMKKEQLNYKGSIFTENCKENIDRGPMENLGVLFLDWIAKGESTISRQDAYMQAGITLGRAQVAMNRSPQKKRMKPFINWLKVLDASPDKRELVQEKLSELRQQLMTQ